MMAATDGSSRRSAGRARSGPDGVLTGWVSLPGVRHYGFVHAHGRIAAVAVHKTDGLRQRQLAVASEAHTVRDLLAGFDPGDVARLEVVNRVIGEGRLGELQSATI